MINDSLLLFAPFPGVFSGIYFLINPVLAIWARKLPLFNLARRSTPAALVADIFGRHFLKFNGLFPAILDQPAADISSLPAGSMVIDPFYRPCPPGRGKTGNVEDLRFFRSQKTVQFLIDVAVKLFFLFMLPVLIFLSYTFILCLHVLCWFFNVLQIKGRKP